MKSRLAVTIFFVVLLLIVVQTLVLTGQAVHAVPSELPLFSATAIELPDVWQGSVAWGDYDGDSDLDIVLTSGYLMTEVFRNDGNGVFTDVNAGLEMVNGGSTAWGDYDRDGDLDLLLVGQSVSSAQISRIYRNDGQDIFTDINAGLIGIWSFVVTVWGDYDNDGDLDILMSGLTRSYDSVTRIYRNDGDDIFTDIEAAALADVYMDSMAWGDYDNDDDLDMLWAGWISGAGYASRVYRNDGNDVFTDINAALQDVNQSSVAWGDYDNDGDADILLAGWSPSLYEVTRIYRNDGNDVFTDIQAALANVARGPSTAWGDYDNDGDLDILLRGCTNWNDDFGACGGSITKVYNNDGSGVFTDTNEALPTISEEPVVWGDYDNDGDLDILVTTGELTTIYSNNSSVPNTIPTAPASLSTALSGESIRFEWAEAGDAETPSPGLSYNLRVGTIPGGIETVSPMANADAYRQLPQLGGAGYGLSAALKNLPQGTYYWSVQAVDTAFAGSPFSAEQSFTIWKAYFPIMPIIQQVGQ